MSNNEIIEKLTEIYVYENELIKLIEKIKD